MSERRLILVWFLLRSFEYVFCIGPVQRVYEAIVNNASAYNKEYPPYDDGHAINVTASAPFLALLAVEENRQTVSYIARLNLTWSDPRLVFDPDEIGAFAVVMPAGSVWQPRVDLYNSLNNKEVNEQRQDTSVEVRADGQVSQLWYFQLQTICQVDVAAYPFDKQWCNLGLVSSLASYDQLVLIALPNVSTSSGIPEWDIAEVRAFNSSFPQYGRKYSVAEISIHLKRNPQFYIFFLILPTFIIASVCITAMLLPIKLDLGERINIGVAGLLSLTFMLSVIIGELPRTPYLPLMGKWVIVEMFFCSLGMLVPMGLNLLESCLYGERQCLKMKNGKEILCTITAVSFCLLTLANTVTTVMMFSFPPRPYDMTDFSTL